MVDAILFGSLSSLTDMAQLERLAFNRAFRRAGIDRNWTDADYTHRIHTLGRFAGIDDQVDALGGLSRAEFYDLVESTFREVIDEAAPTPDPWFLSALDVALRERIPLALVSGADRQTTLRVLAALFGRRASTYFKVVTDASAVAAQKPAPDLYAFALAQLGVDASHALAVEATAEGVKAAHDAGLYTVSDLARTPLGRQKLGADAPRAKHISENITWFRKRASSEVSSSAIMQIDDGQEWVTSANGQARQLR